MTLQDRAEATQRVIDEYRAKPFAWNGAHCIRLARAMGKELGHDLPPIPLIQSPLSAKKALAKQGCESTSDLLDKYFTRLPAPAYAMVGDLVAVPSEHFEAICVADGLGNLVGWHDSDLSQMSVIKFGMSGAIAAWRL